MRPDKGVFKRKGSDVWQHRIYIPRDLQCLYGGKDALPARSLRTKNLTEANRLARLRLADFEQEFTAKRQASLRVPSEHLSAKRTLLPDTIERLAASHHVKIIEGDFVLRGATLDKASADPEAFWGGKILPRPVDWRTFRGQPYSYWDYLCENVETPIEVGVAYVLHEQRKSRLASVKDALRLGKVAVLSDEANALLAPYDHNEEARLKLIRRLMEAEISALGSIIEAEAPHFPSLISEPDGGAENPLLSAAAAPWIDEKKSLDLTGRRIEDCEAAVALFVEVIGDKPMADYTKGDVREFKKTLRSLPANRTKIRETRDLNARAAAKEAQRLGLAPMSVKTANNKYIATLYNLFEYAIGSYDKVNRNPFANATLPTRSNPREEWDSFSLDALRIIFNAPLYRGCRSARHWLESGPIVPRESARFWLPLILLYTGARVNEACKLRVIDIREQDGIPFFNIEWEEDDEDAGIAGRVKNIASERKVPIHENLISFGFLDFVAKAQESGHERLFSELKPNRHGKLYNTISQRFSDTFLPRLGVKTDKTSLKSFRHNFVDAATNSRIPDEIIRALKGDTRPGTLARYGDGKTELEILAEHMMKLQFKGLDLAHLVTRDRSKLV